MDLIAKRKLISNRYKGFSMRDNNGRFTKGMIPWNKGKYGYMPANKTSFTKEDLEKKRVIGKPRAGKDGMICSSEEKVPVRSYNGKVYMHQRRVSYAKWLMEKELGRKLTNNEIVYHIDGDAYNNEIDNLEVITRSELLKRNKKQ